MRLLALIIFIVMYILIIALAKYRVWVVLSAAVLYLVLGILPITELGTAINFNALMMIAGTMVIVYYFIDSQMPNRISGFLLSKSRNVMWVTILMSLFAGLISAFIDNVATVLMVAPVGLAICKKLSVSPVPMLLSIAVSSNLQGAATLVGDTTSIMLGAYAHMDFMDFFVSESRPGMFFAVELGALATLPIMMFLFKKDKAPVLAIDKTTLKSVLPSIMLLGMVALLICVSFIPNKPDITNGLICCGLAALTILFDFGKMKAGSRVLEAVTSIDFETLLLLTSLFIVIGGITEIGIIDELAGLIVKIGGNNIFLLYTMIVWGSVLVSAVVDNIPYVATMLPVIRSLTLSLGMEPSLLYFGLLCGATLGGNLTPIGASANITAVGMLRKEGYSVSFGDFARIGMPFTLAAVTAGYVFIWLVWS